MVVRYDELGTLADLILLLRGEKQHLILVIVKFLLLAGEQKNLRIGLVHGLNGIPDIGPVYYLLGQVAIVRL